MIAEINGKISRTGTNLKETLEDNLTGNVFGSLRYIPFSKGIKKVLEKVICDELFDKYESEEWSDSIEFWPYHKDGEIDLVINLKLVTIAIEAKYNSGLSSDDDISNDYKSCDKSKNQLARESRIVKEFAEASGTKPILLFLAREKDGRETVEYVNGRNIIEASVPLKFISWEDIYVTLEEISKSSDLSYFEKIIVQDIVSLLKRKGFNSFKSFKELIIEKEIDEEMYYKFYLNDSMNLIQVQGLEDFGFKSEINIEKDGYYEFL